jgi:hypothetical protein
VLIKDAYACFAHLCNAAQCNLTCNVDFDAMQYNAACEPYEKRYAAALAGKLKKYSIREALLEDRNNANNDEFGGTDFLAFATFV